MNSSPPYHMIATAAVTSFESSWSAFTELSLVQTNELPNTQSSYISAVVWIGGSWMGNVILTMPRSLSEELYQNLFNKSPADEKDSTDIVQELVNMTAGNLKSRLPGISALAVPGSFASNTLLTLQDGMNQILSQPFLCRNQIPLKLSVYSLDG